MRVGILSDIHANWPALQAALAVLDRENVDRVFCLGDIVGYYTEPAECVEELIDRGVDCIRGNHERYLLGQGIEQINDSARAAIEFTRETLDAGHIAFLEGLRNTMRVPGHFLLVHGSPRHRDEYLLTEEQAHENLELLAREFPEFRICFHGHTHLPSVVCREETQTGFHRDRRITLDPERTYLINPGSVGQPRDGCPKACFVTYDTATRELVFYRREYDIATVKARVEEVGLDPRLALRLERGC